MVRPMVRVFRVFLLLVALPGCGAKSGLDDGTPDAAQDPHDGQPQPPTCRSLPSCIEAEITTPDGVVIAFAQPGEVTVTMHRGTWLETAEAEDPSMAVQVFPDAMPGPVELSLNPAPMYVDVRRPDAHCTVHGDGMLERVDLSPGGVTEGTFSGRTQDYCAGGEHLVRLGWFRLTIP
jgi:hypothetical protein